MTFTDCCFFSFLACSLNLALLTPWASFFDPALCVCCAVCAVVGGLMVLVWSARRRLAGDWFWGTCLRLCDRAW